MPVYEVNCTRARAWARGPARQPAHAAYVACISKQEAGLANSRREHTTTRVATRDAIEHMNIALTYAQGRLAVAVADARVYTF